MQQFNTLRFDLQKAGVAPQAIDNIIKVIMEYWHKINELECMLLEFLPNSELVLKYKVSETCTIVYSISKE